MHSEGIAAFRKSAFDRYRAACILVKGRAAETALRLCNSAGIATTFAVIVASGICGFSHAQDKPPTPSQDQNTTSATQTSTPFVFHFTSREVVVDVIATEPGGPLTDLEPGDLEVIDRAPDTDPLSQTVSSLRVVDPAVATIPRGASTLPPIKAVCNETPSITSLPTILASMD
jgi:hypothetical protein